MYLFNTASTFDTLRFKKFPPNTTTIDIQYIIDYENIVPIQSYKYCNKATILIYICWIDGMQSFLGLGSFCVCVITSVYCLIRRQVKNKPTALPSTKFNAGLLELVCPEEGSCDKIVQILTNDICISKAVRGNLQH